jgi:drug/metabolite transporter (DMT)-like permease
MSWFLFALSAPVLLTVVNFIDKYIVEREVRDARAMPIFAGIMGTLAAVLLLALGMATLLSVRDTLLLIAAGILIIGGAIFYFRAAGREQMSQIIILNQLTPVFVLMLASLVLNQAITGTQFAGFWLILAAVVGVSGQTGSTRTLRESTTFWLMMAVNATIAVRVTLIGLLDANPSFGTLFVYQGIGQGIGALLLYLLLPSFRQAFNQSAATMRKPALGIIGFSESLFVIAQVLGSLAITLGPAALVSVLGGIQVFYGILLGWLLMAVAPTVFREAVSWRDLLRKVAFALVLLMGLYLVLAQ